MFEPGNRIGGQNVDDLIDILIIGQDHHGILSGIRLRYLHHITVLIFDQEPGHLFRCVEGQTVGFLGSVPQVIRNKIRNDPSILDDRDPVAGRVNFRKDMR